MLIELELLCISSRTLQNWIYRGIIYTFFGVVQMQQALSMQAEKAVIKLPQSSQAFTLIIHWPLLSIQISSWLIVSMGVIYSCCGVTCLQSLSLNTRFEYQQVRPHDD